jgi:trehalose 6-phosphate phosphatase
MPQRHLFADHALLPRFAAAEVLLAFDYDGTLAPIVPRPEDAQMRTSTRRLLSEASRGYPCAVISGRAQADLRDMLGPVPIWELVGNHGLEPSSQAAKFEKQVRRWLPRLHQALDPIQGVVIEDKGLSVSVHYRQARRKVAAVRAIIEVTEALRSARVVGGKMVMNVLPENGPNKGSALERVRTKLGCDAAIYVGDDTTDEDVFALTGPKLLTVRVGEKRGSKADYYLSDQEEVDELLRRLVALRRPRKPHRMIG